MGSKNGSVKFPEADIDGELSPGKNKNVEVDSESSDIAASMEVEKQIAEKKKEMARMKKNSMQNLKSFIIVSAVVVAVAGAAFAISKKLREK